MHLFNLARHSLTKRPSVLWHLKQMKKQGLIYSALCGLLLAFSHQAGAVSITLHDAHELGFVNFGIPSGDADRTLYVNHLINQALGTTDHADGQTYTRSTNFFSSLDAAVWNSNGTGTSVNVGTTGFEYLFAKYDGPNYGSEVWYIGGLTGTITIPATAGGYGLSGWTLFTPGSQVPDGGSTVALLGLTLVGLAVVRARLQRG
jgi:VPDSG-CTERM motif